MCRLIISIVLLVLLSLPVMADGTIKRKQASKKKKPTTLILIQYDRGRKSLFSGVGRPPGISKQMALSEIVDRLSKMPKLRSVWVMTGTANLRVEEYRQLARLTRVENIDIRTFAAIHGPELLPLTKMKRLKTLEFTESRVKLSVLKTLIKSRSLKSFRIPNAGDAWKRELKCLNAGFRVYSHGNYAP